MSPSHDPARIVRSRWVSRFAITGSLAFGFARPLIVPFFVPLFASAILFALAPTPARADVALDKDGKIRLMGDFRVRLEEDWNSRDQNGDDTADRGRVRLRVRVGAIYQHSPSLAFGMRIRSGDENSQQSPHVTIFDFNNNPQGGASTFSFDQYYLKWKDEKHGLWGEVGRDAFAFYKNNEIFWDDDVTPTGAAGGADFKLGDEGRIGLRAGYFGLPDGTVRVNGYLGAGQVVFVHTAKEFSFTGAAGYFLFDGDPGAVYLLNNNGLRNYRIAVVNAQAKFGSGKWPWTVSADGMKNTYKYKDTDCWCVIDGRDQRNNKSGYDASVALGQLNDKGQALFSYTYAAIGTLAVNASFAEDDWSRWGGPNGQGSNSDFRGHELRAAYAFDKNWNVNARLWITRAITSLRESDRLRIDFNLKW
jgi:hypothetical protein